ncbi:MAG: hypothetical protein ACC645_18390 [Pirellulales bacterium]
MIECDCDDGNGPRIWAWKVGLQQLADEFGLAITVRHVPPGASKWNLIEHRMFSLISANWAGEPLTSYEVVLKYIRATRSTTGFRCRAKLDKSHYPKKAIITDDQKATVQLTPGRVLPKWNYLLIAPAPGTLGRSARPPMSLGPAHRRGSDGDSRGPV